MVIIVIGLEPSLGRLRVKETFFSDGYFAKSFPRVLSGLQLSIHILLVIMVGAATLSTLIALVCTSRSPILFPLRIPALIYTTMMRDVPIVVMLYLIGFSISGLGLFGHIDLSVLDIIAVVMGYSAYVSEILCVGLNGIYSSQRAPARSLGLTSGQTVRLIVIPQASCKVAPALMNNLISMQRDVGLISVLSMVDTVRVVQTDVISIYNFTPHAVVSLLFIPISVPFILLNGWYAERLRKCELSGGTV